MTGRVVSRAGWRLLTGELARRRRAIAFLAGWSVVESLPALLSGIAVAGALDRGFLAGRPLIGLGWLGVLGLAMVVQALATRNTFPWLAAIVEPLRDALVRMVVTTALRRAVEGGERGDGSVVARICGQTEAVRNLVAALLRTLRPTVASLVLALAGLVALAPIVAAIAVPLILTSLALFAWLSRALAVRQREMILAEETMARTVTDVVEGLRDVVACGAAGTARDLVDRAVMAEARAALAMARTSSARSTIMAIGGVVPVILVLALAPWLLGTGRLTSGALVGAITYLVGTLDPALRALTGTVATWSRQLGVLLHRIAETSAARSEASAALPEASAALPEASAARSGTSAARSEMSAAVPETPGPRGAARPGSGELRVTGLTFAYGPRAEPVIDDLTLSIPEGEHLAIVGPSGIGKSTLASLLAGLAVPRRGTVRLGGVAVADIDAAHLRRSVALIPQEAYVFTGTLRENLAYLRPDATTAELGQAVAALGMRPLVDRLGGYDAALGVGGPELSAGERQLIALCRVHVSAARVVVLDEATCHLDPVAEARAERAFAGRTLVVIAHRISSARRARRILLLDGTTGSHEELLATSAMYAGLVGHWIASTNPEVSGGVRRTG
ncbi:ATP-binding cassette, subfamily C [Nonomuraea solani]|uniref:ATP-binding cassette, subfamily C n=1 Tax=Nonomuraea solani TaxID=1144553 RepID=A0A1H5WDT1_9ACTN|nr:ABC transporter ATP-binding protein [Nonomuraea solani]SEF97635.1 ATP-binding cassette, subfamily C [Nonomuraea solani]